MTELKIDLDIEKMMANFHEMPFINEFLTDAGPILMADLWPYIEPSVVVQVKEVSSSSVYNIVVGICFYLLL